MAEYLYDVIPEAVSIKRYSRGCAIGSPNSVRVYRSSPERVTLQIRGAKSYASISLPFEIAKNVADALNRECFVGAPYDYAADDLAFDAAREDRIFGKR